MEHLLEKYKNELDTLVFDDFTSEAALVIGQNIIDIAKECNYAVTIDISKFNHQIFHFSFDGTTPDKDLWVQRKKNVVQHFLTSSLYMAAKLKKDGASLSDKYGLPADQYTATGGSVPIIVKNVGVIGAITVAGLTPEEDHHLVVTAMKKYLDNQK